MISVFRSQLNDYLPSRPRKINENIGVLFMDLIDAHLKLCQNNEQNVIYFGKYCGNKYDSDDECHYIVSFSDKCGEYVPNVYDISQDDDADYLSFLFDDNQKGWNATVGVQLRKRGFSWRFHKFLYSGKISSVTLHRSVSKI